MSSLAHSDSNMNIKEWRTKTRLSEEGMREKFLSEWSSFIEDLQPVQEDIFTSA